tara:strand:- start:558 stop:857 length:300 start_codon:yes stop_codon:yes gene_type:complete
MRKVTQQIKQSFFERKAKTIGNTETDGNSVWLHGNEIIKRDSSGLIFWTLAGWNTPTTRERINGILDVGVHQKNFEPVLNGHTIDESDWFALEQGPACG